MADLSTGAGLGGAPQQAPQPQDDISDLVQKWQQSDLLPADTPVEGKGGSEKKKGASKETTASGGEVFTDSQEEANEANGTSLSTHLDVQMKKAVGAGYATLSQNELDSLQAGDPTLLGHKGSSTVARGLPPTGPSGTGNPFFNANPMVAFFRAFANSESMLKFLAWTSAKLAIFSMKTIKETGYAQAQATLNAGKAEAQGQESQAWANFAQGMLGVVSLGVAGAAILRSTRSFNAEQRAKSEEAAAKKTDIEEEVSSNRDQIAKLEARNKAKLEAMEKKGGDGDLQIHIQKTSENKAAKKAEERGQLNAKQQKQYDEQQETDLEIIENSGKRSKFEESSEFREKKMENWKQKDMERWDKMENDKAGSAKETFEKEYKANEKEIKNLQAKNQQLLRKRDHIDAKLKAFNAGRMTHIGQAVQGDPLFMMWNAIGQNGSLGQLAEAYGHQAQAKAALESSYWKAWEEIAGMFLGLENKALDSAIQMQQDANQQINEQVNTINKMADQETNSMHWTG